MWKVIKAEVIKIRKKQRKNRKEKDKKKSRRRKKRKEKTEKEDDNSIINLFLRVGNKNNPCMRETQENLIENSVQDSLPYIQIPNGACKLNLAYPKWSCVLHIVWCHPSRTFYVLPYVLWLVTITNPNPVF